MKQKAKGPRAGGAALIKKIFDEAIREAIPVADEPAAPAPPTKRGRITGAFDEAIREAIPTEAEQRSLHAELELELRRFVAAFDGHPEWLWSPATQRFVRAVRPKLELLGGPVGPRDAGPGHEAEPDAA